MPKSKVKVRVRVPVDRAGYRRVRVRRFLSRSRRSVRLGLACGALVFLIWYLLKYMVPGPPPP